MPGRILLVEDHPIFADALRMTVAKAIPRAAIVHAATLSAAKTALDEEGGFGLVLLDLLLPDAQGFAALIELREHYPKLPVIVVSACADQDVVHKSMFFGAAGFITKSAHKDAFVRAIIDVLAGAVALPPDYLLAEQVLNAGTPTSKIQSLTQQQLRVLRMLCQGLTNKQIARELAVGEATVKAHISEILRKLQVCSRTQAVLEASKADFGRC